VAEPGHIEVRAEHHTGHYTGHWHYIEAGHIVAGYTELVVAVAPTDPIDPIVAGYTGTMATDSTVIGSVHYS
jgi:hypothetical protein